MRIRVVSILVKAFFDGVKPLQTYASRLSVTGQAKRGRAKVIQLLIIALMVFSFVLIEGMLVINILTYQSLGVLLDMPFLGVFVSTLANFFLLFFVGSIGLSSIIYRGNDISLVSTFPITEVEMLASRLLIAYILYLPLSLAIMLPATGVATFLQGVDITFVLGAVVLLFVGPLLPLSLAVLVATLLVRLTKGERFALFEQLFVFIVVLGFSLAMITLFTRTMGETTFFQPDYQMMMLFFGSTFSLIVKIFPLFVGQAKMLWSVQGLAIHTLIIVLISLGATYVVGKGYAQSLSLVASAQSSTRKKKKKRRRTYRARNPILSLMIRELEVIKGHSVFVIEVVGELFIPLILLGVYALTGVLAEIEGVTSLVASSPLLPYGLFLGVTLISSISMLSSTSISRQGPQSLFDKVLPIKVGEVVKAKIAVHLLLVGVTDLVYLILALLFFSLALSHLLWMVPLLGVVLFTQSAFGLAIDYARPLLFWSIPQQAMKSNLNGLLGMLSSLGVLILVGLLLLVPILVGLHPLVGIALASAVAVVLSMFSWRVVLRYASSR